MAFTLALYYPFIDIENEGWLKSAMLYWDKIHTIVPESIDEPYETRTTLEFYDAGLLIPLRVDSGMAEVEALTDEVIKYLDSPEAAELFLAQKLKEDSMLHVQKVSPYLRTLHRLSSIHPEKLPYEVRHIIKDRGVLKGQRGDWYKVDTKFADFYMTLLAKRLSERVGAGLLTDIPASNKLAIAAKLDASLSDWTKITRVGREYDAYGPRRMAPTMLAQGMLVDLIVEKLQIAPDTPTAKIIKFKEDHADELGRFRQQIANLTQAVTSELPVEHLRQQATDIFNNEVVPATQALKQGLKASKIEWFAENYLKIALLSTSSTSMMAIMGLDVPQALLVGAGISLTASGILYNLDKQQKIRENPYAYVLSAKNAFG